MVIIPLLGLSHCFDRFVTEAGFVVTGVSTVVSTIGIGCREGGELM